MECQLTIAHIRSKRLTPVAEAKCLVVEYLDRMYDINLQSYTDGSVDAENGASAADYVIPTVNVT